MAFTARLKPCPDTKRSSIYAARLGRELSQRNLNRVSLFLFFVQHLQRFYHRHKHAIEGAREGSDFVITTDRKFLHIKFAAADTIGHGGQASDRPDHDEVERSIDGKQG